MKQERKQITWARLRKICGYCFSHELCRFYSEREKLNTTTAKIGERDKCSRKKDCPIWHKLEPIEEN